MPHALQDRFSSLVDAKLRATLVQKDGVVWNNRYEGQPKAGTVKVPVRDTEVTVNPYNKANGVAKTQGATAYIPVVIDKDYAVNELIDGYDAAAVPDNLVADRLDSAGYSLGLQINSDATKELVSAGTILQDTVAVSKTNIYEKIVDARKSLSDAKVPASGRFLLVSSLVYSLLLKSAEFIKASALGDAVVQTGAVGQVAGFLVFEDVTLPAAVAFIAGHPDWCCRIPEWAVPVKLQDLSGSGDYIGASAVQGRKIYAHKVTKGIAVQIFSSLASPTITEATAAGTTTITITAGSGSVKTFYRKFTTTWGAWTEYDADSKPTAAAGNKIEAYGVDAEDVRSANDTHTVTAA